LEHICDISRYLFGDFFKRFPNLSLFIFVLP
jgi:hypothetical protein